MTFTVPTHNCSRSFTAPTHNCSRSFTVPTHNCSRSFTVPAHNCWRSFTVPTHNCSRSFTVLIHNCSRSLCEHFSKRNFSKICQYTRSGWEDIHWHPSVKYDRNWDDIDEKCTRSKYFCKKKNYCVEFHEKPTKDLVADTRPQMQDGGTDVIPS
jgi:hypothetical protein